MKLLYFLLIAFIFFQIAYSDEKETKAKSAEDYDRDHYLISEPKKEPTGLAKFWHKTKSTLNRFFFGLARKFSSKNKKDQRQLREPIPEEPIPVTPELKPIFEHNKPVIQPAIKPLVEKPFIYTDNLGNQIADEEFKLDARNKPKRSKRQAQKAQQIILNNPQVAEIMDKINNLNEGYKKAVSLLQRKLKTETDEKKKIDLNHLYEHIKEASNRFDVIMTFLKEKVLDTKKIPEIVEYIKKIHEIEMKRISSIIEHDFKKKLPEHDHKDDELKHLDARKEEKQDKVKSIANLVDQKPDSENSFMTRKGNEKKEP